MSGKWGRPKQRDLPPDWEQRRRIVRRRAADKCQAEEHHPDCTGIGIDCDHITPNDDHSLSNLQWLSRECHKVKTQQESRAGWRRKRFREPPRHPGLG